MKIALIGYKGKTGSKVYQELLDNNYEVIAIDKDGVLLSHVIQDVDLVIDFTNKNINLNDGAGNIYGRMGINFKSPYAALNEKYPALQNYLNTVTPEVRGRIANDVNATFLALEEADV